MDQRHHGAELVVHQRQRLVGQAPLDQQRVDDALVLQDRHPGKGAHDDAGEHGRDHRHQHQRVTQPRLHACHPVRQRITDQQRNDRRHQPDAQGGPQRFVVDARCIEDKTLVVARRGKGVRVGDGIARVERHHRHHAERQHEEQDEEQRRGCHQPGDRRRARPGNHVAAVISMPRRRPRHARGRAPNCRAGRRAACPRFRSCAASRGRRRPRPRDRWRCLVRRQSPRRGSYP